MTHVGSITKIYQDVVEQAGYNAGCSTHLYFIIAGGWNKYDCYDGDECSEESSELTHEQYIMLEKFRIHPLKDYQ